MLTSWILATASLSVSATAAPPPPSIDLLAIRARHAETASHGALEHAVILIEDGVITAVGEDLPIERGIPVLDLPEDWVVMPGIVQPYSRYGLDGNGYNDSRGHIRASDELYSSGPFAGALEYGVTTIGLYPAGSGIPGKAVAIRPSGATVEDMILQDDAYLKVVLRSSGSSKRNLRNGFKEADEWLEKEEKNREKWEKDQEKKKKKKDDDDEKDDDEKEDEDDVYEPVKIKPEVQPFLDLRDGSLSALVSLSKSGDYLHFLDAKGDEEFTYNLRLGLSRFADFFHVIDRMAENGGSVVIDPELSLHPDTSRKRNLPAEFASAGVPIAFIPRVDGTSGLATYRFDIGVLIGAGLDRQDAIRAMTLTGAGVLGVDDRVGSIEVGKHANLLILDGDPFEPGTELEAVMLEGEVVHGEMR